MPNKITLNRFPLFGLFAYRAARHMDYPEETARLLGYSTAVLYAIFKAKAQKQRESTDQEVNKMPKEVETAKTGTLTFGGKDFTVIYGKGKHPARPWWDTKSRPPTATTRKWRVSSPRAGTTASPRHSPNTWSCIHPSS